MNPGDKIGRYVLERLLGRGGMGEVFQAVDPLIGRKIAIKTLHSNLEHKHADELQQRFLREAMAAGRLSHPNITTLFDVGEDPITGTAFIAMEFIDGKTLETIADDGSQLDLERTVELGATLAEALGYAHSEGVVHRDVKPANILVTNNGVPKITDFGIARLDSSTLTVQGALLGTPYYMSPEQVNGVPVDGRTDLYALGIILFELLTGTRPYSGRSLMTMLRAIITEEPPDLTGLRGEISPALSVVVRKALSKDPENRFQSGAELASALRAVNLQPSSPEPEPEPEIMGGATVIGVSLAGLADLAGTLEFASGNRRVHLRSKKELVLGRDPSADIRLADVKVSRRHAIVHLTDDGALFTDLASSNGSTCNGIPVIAPIKLGDGDVIGIGASIYFLVRFRRLLRPPQSVALVVDSDEYLLNHGEIAFGSDPREVDIRIADPQVKGVHAHLIGTIAGPQVTAVDSATPLSINGQLTHRALLSDRSNLSIGSCKMTWIEHRADGPSSGPTRF